MPRATSDCFTVGAASAIIITLSYSVKGDKIRAAMYIAARSESMDDIFRENIYNSGFQILRALMEDGNEEKVKRALTDDAYREQLCREYFSEHEQPDL